MKSLALRLAAQPWAEGMTFGDVDLSPDALAILGECRDIGCTIDHVAEDALSPMHCPRCGLHRVQAVWIHAERAVALFCIDCEIGIGIVRRTAVQS